MRRILALLMIIAMHFSFLLLCSANFRYHYDPEKRVVLSEYTMTQGNRPPAGLDLNVRSADVVAVVRVMNSRERSSKSTTFTLKVLDEWYGEAVGEEVTVRIRGGLNSGVTKPRKNDKLIVFLVERDPEEYDFDYILADDENAMFAINPPDDTLYSFSDNPLLTSFDGLPPEKLKEAIAEVSEEIGKEW